jgi:hypothetical protein
MDGETTKEIKQVCRIEIIFPIDSDEQALAIKRGVSDAVKDLEKKRFTFSIAEA